MPAIPQLIEGLGGASQPTWSPDGQKIAFALGTEEGNHIFQMDADGSNVEQLTFGSEFNEHPDYSPDGQWLLFMAAPARREPTEIYVISMADTP